MTSSASHLNLIPADPTTYAQEGSPATPSGSTGGQLHSGPPAHRAGGFEAECDHRLEKLEFALAVALTRGDKILVKSLRHQIAALGGNQEEPGT